MGELAKAATAKFGKMRIDRFANRNIAGTNTPSKHSGGHALDLFGGGLQAKADWATKQAGISHVIYNRRCWTPSRGWHAYTGLNPHTDHVHMD